MRSTKKLIATIGLSFACLSMAVMSPPAAFASSAPPQLSTTAQAQQDLNEGDLPRVPVALSAEELGKIGASQDMAEINEIIAMASPTQNVQVLLNFETSQYDAAVLVDQSAEEQLADFQAKIESSTPVLDDAENAALRSGIYLCSYTSSPKGTSYHYSGTLFWCGSGSWSSNAQPGWYQYYNGISTNALVGPSNISWMACPGYTTCSVNPAGISLGYVSFS